jgi:hypothetical protein
VRFSVPLLGNTDYVRTLSGAIIKQAVADCVHIHYRDWKPFTSNHHELTDIFQFRLISEEYNDLVDWMESDRFTAMCDAVGFEDEFIRQKLTAVLQDGDCAKEVAKTLEMRPEQSLRKKAKLNDQNS